MGDKKFIGAKLYDIVTAVQKRKQIKKQFPYIGGTTEQTRKKLWSVKPKIKAATDSIANAYGISSELLRNRLDAEGFTDKIIKGQFFVSIFAHS